MIARPANKMVIAAFYRAIAAASLAAMMLAMTGGCDDKRDLPPPRPATAPAAVSTRPTTQQLVGGPRKKLSLGSAAVTIEVPESWKDTMTENSRWVEGYTPSGEVRLQLTSVGQTMNAGAITALDKKTRDEAAAKPERISVVPLRSIGGAARAMERREMLRLPVPRDDGSSEMTDTMDWSIDVFVPADKIFTFEILHFSGMTMRQYEQDKEFLEQISNSLRYDAAQRAP